MAAPQTRTERVRQALVFLAVWAVGELLALTAIAHSPTRAGISMIEQGNSFGALAFAGAFAIYVASRPSRARLLSTVGIGVAFELARAAVSTKTGGSYFTTLARAPGFGLGFAAFGGLGLEVRKASPELRPRAIERLLSALLLPGLVILASFFLQLTEALQPRVEDQRLYLVENGLGFQPSWLVGRLFAAVPPIEWLSLAVYIALPLFLAIVYAAHERRGTRSSSDVFDSFLWIGILGFLCYHAMPVIGPKFAFAAVWPTAVPPSEVVPATAVVVPPIPRNCWPSLHTSWALAALLRTRGLGRGMRMSAVAFFVLTELATLGLGVHYLVDLVVAVPFTFAVEAALVPATPGTVRPRRFVILNAVAWMAFWYCAIRFGARVFAETPLLTLVAVIATLAVSILGFRVLRRNETDLETRVAHVAPLVFDRPRAAIAAIFFFSGFAGLIYEVVFAKSLALTFGSMAVASTTVLATYMGGLALGTFLGGRLFLERRPLLVYAACEGVVAVWCALSPVFIAIVHRIYVASAAGVDPSAGWLRGLQVALGAAVLLPPTIAMGITTPALARHLAGRDASLGRTVGLLYAANTLGAALGAMLTGYFVLPALGIRGSTWLGAATNLIACLLAMRIAERGGEGVAAAREDLRPATEPGTVGRLALVVLTVGGVVTLALEVTYVHLLAVIAGNSAYAFSLMLFAFLIALGIGASLGRYALARGVRAFDGAAGAQALLACAILLGVFMWAAIPSYFASFATYPITRTFAAREVVRGLVCCGIMVPPALCIGAAYPLAIDAVGAATSGDRVRVFATASAWNTAGNIAGALLATFLLVPRFGSLRTLQILAGTALVLSALPWLARVAREVPLSTWPGIAAALLLAVQPRSFDQTALASGANVYFAPQSYGRAIDWAESIDGGLTTIAHSQGTGARPLLTMLTNGKFQGDDGLDREVPAQIGFALAPLLHLQERGSALVIGLGTGASARVVADAGFQRVDVVELSADVVRLSKQHFAPLQAGVLSRPNVRTVVTDGRNFLTLSRDRYDLIGMELSSIWFAGAASFYSRDFYRLAKAHLTDRGVLQQWVQLHRLHREDLTVILATLRSEFSHVRLYFIGTQGILVACEHACDPTPEAVERIDGDPALAPVLAMFKGSSASLLKDVILTPAAVDGFWNALMRATGDDPLLSTDDNLFLEYSTPRGNVRDYGRSLKTNLAWLAAIGAGRLPGVEAEPAMPSPALPAPGQTP